MANFFKLYHTMSFLFLLWRCLIERQRKIKNKQTKNSNFWIGIYGENWAYSGKQIEEYTQILQHINRNKRLFYLKGLKAKNHILSLL